MAQLIFDLVDPAELVEYVRQWDVEVLRPEMQVRLDQWLPDELTEDLEFRVRRGGLNDVDAAEYRAFDTPAPMTGRPGVSRISGRLGPVSRQIPLGEEETLRLRSLERGNDNPLVDAIYADAERMIRAVQARIELARGDLIDDGKVVISERGLALEADFGRHADMSDVAGTLWSDATNATPLANLLAWVEAYVDHNGVEPAGILIPKATRHLLNLNKEMREFNAAGGTTPTRLNQAAVDSSLASEGLPPFIEYDGKVRVNGALTRVLPANKIYLVPPAGEALGKTFYGVTAEAIRLREEGMIEAEAMPGVVAVVAKNDHPVQTFTVGTALALPAMPNPDLVMDIQVLA
jgi:hypothetical protein